jgi:hypothetical protein
MRASNFSTVMRNQAPTVLGSLLLIISCSLHDTGYLQEGDPVGVGAGGSGSTEGGAPGTSAGMSAGIGGAAEGGAAEGGAAEGGAPSTDGGAMNGGVGGTGAPEPEPCDGEQVKCASDAMIADFESDDGRLCVPGSGTVVAYGDGTGSTSPPIGDVKSYDAADDCGRGSAYALHASVEGAEDWGFGFALRFPQEIDTVEAGYKGIRFKAKVAATRQISLKVAMPSTLGASFGGTCVPMQSPMKLCNDHPAAAVVVEAGDWQDYEVEFASLEQEGWGVAAEPDYAAVLQIHVVLPGPVSSGDADYDIWLDDISFYE